MKRVERDPEMVLELIAARIELAQKEHPHRLNFPMGFWAWDLEDLLAAYERSAEK